MVSKRGGFWIEGLFGGRGDVIGRPFGLYGWAEPDTAFIRVGEFYKVGVVVAVDQFGLAVVAAVEFIGQGVHVGDLSGEGVEEHVDERHLATGGVQVGSIEAEVSVDLGGGEQGAAGSAGGVEDGLAGLGVVADVHVGQHIGDGFGGEVLSEVAIGDVHHVEFAQRVAEAFGLQVGHFGEEGGDGFFLRPGGQLLVGGLEGFTGWVVPVGDQGKVEDGVKDGPFGFFSA